jgi:surface-anchored protein
MSFPENLATLEGVVGPTPAADDRPSTERRARWRSHRKEVLALFTATTALALAACSSTDAAPPNAPTTLPAADAGAEVTPDDALSPRPDATTDGTPDAQPEQRRLVPLALPRIVGADVGSASSVSAIDLDGDGKLDLLAGAYGAKKVVWYRNEGGGAFGPEQPIEAAADGVWFTIGADLDGDGDADVVVGRYSGLLAWYENLGGGTFRRHEVDVDVEGPWLAVGDLDGDGRKDIVAAPDGGSEVYWYRGLGGSTFAKRSVIASGIKKLAGVRVFDIDGDGKDDLALGGGEDDHVAWFLNEGAGKLGPKRTATSGKYTGLIDVADLDGDGRLDLVTLAYVGETLGWLPNRGDGTFGPERKIPVTLGPYAAVATDLDGDGARDLVVGTYGSDSRVEWLRNEGSGVFARPQLISTAMGQVAMIAAADLDGDGDSDLVVASSSRSQLLSVENRRGASAKEVVAPPAGKYLEGQRLDTTIHFGFPVTVSGIPEIDLRIGTKTVRAAYVTGNDTPALTFRHVVAATDTAPEGIAVASPEVRLAGGRLTDPLGGDVDRAIPNVDLGAVRVAGEAPYVRSIERIDPTPTDATNVKFRVVFNKPIRDPDPTDFVVDAPGGVRDAVVTSVTASGNACEVVLSTGTGSGVLGLQVPSAATLRDADGNGLAAAFRGGEVYTMLRGPERVITSFYRTGHRDLEVAHRDELLALRIAGTESLALDKVVVYGGSEALTTRPAGTEFDFLGVAPAAPVYIWPHNGSIPELPDLGIGASGVRGGTFGSYFNEDPRASAAGAWLKLRLVGFLGPEGGHFAIYRARSSGLKVWISTANGISADDAVHLLEGSHQHFSFAFTKPGLYEVDVVASGFRDANGNGIYDPGIDPYTESGVETVYFGVDQPGGPQPHTIRPGMTGRR